MDLKIQTFCSVLLPPPQSVHHIQISYTYSFQNNVISNPSCSIHAILMILYNFLQPPIFQTILSEGFVRLAFCENFAWTTTTRTTTKKKKFIVFNISFILPNFSKLLESTFRTNEDIEIRLQITSVNQWLFTAKLNLLL